MALILWGQGIDTVRSNCSTAIDDAAVVINANVREAVLSLFLHTFCTLLKILSKDISVHHHDSMCEVLYLPMRLVGSMTKV